MNMENVVFSKFVSAGKKKYYLDVKKSKIGSLYLTVREVTEGDTPDKNESRRIMVFDNAIREFAAALSEAASKITPREKAAKAQESASI
jgi:hypothetical protein